MIILRYILLSAYACALSVNYLPKSGTPPPQREESGDSLRFGTE